MFTSKCIEKVFVDPNSRFVTITVAMVDSESHPRPRRTRHDSAKHYDVERKDLELTEVLDVLQCYVDYGGGINCSVCGKSSLSQLPFWLCQHHLHSESLSSIAESLY